MARRKPSRNWDTLNKQAYGEQVKNRDVHGSQSIERGERGTVEKPTKQRILAFVGAAIFGVLGYLATMLILVGAGFFQYATNNQGESFLGFKATELGIQSDWRLYAGTAFVFVMSYLILYQKAMISWRSSNSMVDGTDINTYENDQHVMLPEEAYREFDWFPDTGAHSSVQVSSMLSHVMVSRKGLKRVQFTVRHKKDVKADGVVVAYKGAPQYDEHGLVRQSHEPIIDEAFGQELFTASGIPVDEKEIRRPVDVRKIDYNPIDASGNRSFMDKQPYDTVAELIDNDWEIPEYEVQRPAGAYLVDTAPVNTMVLAITRAGKGNCARFVR